MGNKTLDAARAARLDEFHTRYGDALAGLEPFRDRLAGADILLDTNDGDWSAFWCVLSDRFDEWRIGRIRSVSWDPDWDTLFASDDGGGRVFERTRHGVTERRLACAGSIDGDERRLSIWAFDKRTQRAAYETQGHRCAVCGGEFGLADMHADHIVPWSRGGHTVPDNCQMLCRDCNLKKGAQA